MSATSFNLSSDGSAVAQRAAASGAVGISSKVPSEPADTAGPSFMSGFDAALQAENAWPRFVQEAGGNASPPVTSPALSSSASIAAPPAATATARAHQDPPPLQALDNRLSGSSPSSAASAAAAMPARRLPAGSLQNGLADDIGPMSRTTPPAPNDPALPDDGSVMARAQADPTRGDGGQTSSSAETSAPGSRTTRHGEAAHRQTATADPATTGGSPSATDAVPAPALPATPAPAGLQASVQPKPQGSGLPSTSGASSPPAGAALLPGSVWTSPPADLVADAAPADGSLAAGLPAAAPTRPGGAASTPSGADASSASQGRPLHGSQATAARPATRSAGGAAASGAPTRQGLGNDSPPGRPVEQTAGVATSVTTDVQNRPHASSGNATPVARSTAGASAVLVGMQDPASAVTTPGQDVHAAGAAPDVVGHDAPVAGPGQSPVAAAGTAPPVTASAADVSVADATPAEAVGELMAQASSTEGGATLTVSLHPKELGAVTVRLARAADGSTRITVSASTPSTLRSLMGSRDQLHAALDAASVPAAGRHLSFELSEPSVSASPQHSHATTADNETHAVLREQSGSQFNPDGASSRSSEQPGEGTRQDQRPRSGPGRLGASVPSDDIVAARSSGSATSLTSRASAAGINITA